MNIKNAFYMTACRFHVKEKNKLYIIGYFQNNVIGDAVIEVYLDEEKLYYEPVEQQLRPMDYRIIEGQTISQQYFLEVVLPDKWKKCHQLKIYNIFDEQKDLLTSLKVSQMKEWEHYVAQNIDQVLID